MMEEFRITGDWEKIKKQLIKENPELEDVDLTFTHGQEGKMLGRIERRLGRTKRERITERISQMMKL
jgi:hypothetical protein